MNFYVLTLFPEMIEQGLNTSITGRAMEKGLIHVNAVDIREFSTNKHKKVDDYPYGGGAGMVMQAEPVYGSYKHVKGLIGHKPRMVYMTPQGKTFNQNMAEDFSKEEDLVILCGHYEGIDERVLEMTVTDYVSIGDYVLTGGELASMVIIDSVSRLIPGVLSNSESSVSESFHDNLLEYPQYTRPESFEGKEVPPVLRSGHHGKIDEWRLKQSIERTKQYRPDLYEKYLEQKSSSKDSEK